MLLLEWAAAKARRPEPILKLQGVDDVASFPDHPDELPEGFEILGLPERGQRHHFVFVAGMQVAEIARHLFVEQP
jgi:hypothetical protein